MPDSGAAAAIAAFGTQAAMAEALGVSQQVVSKWLHQGWVPALRALEIEMLTGVPRARLVSPRLRELVGAEQ